MNAIRLGESALLVVDVQRGFTELCPDELPVPGGLAIVAAVNELLALDWKRIDASQDWHPPDHCSFFGRRDNLYPPHCVRGTPGADFLPGLHTDRFHAIWRNGHQPDFEAYALTAQHPGYPGQPGQPANPTHQGQHNAPGQPELQGPVPPAGWPPQQPPQPPPAPQQ